MKENPETSTLMFISIIGLITLGMLGYFAIDIISPDLVDNYLYSTKQLLRLVLYISAIVAALVIFIALLNKCLKNNRNY